MTMYTICFYFPSYNFKKRLISLISPWVGKRIWDQWENRKKCSLHKKMQVSFFYLFFFLSIHSFIIHLYYMVYDISLTWNDAQFTHLRQIMSPQSTKLDPLKSLYGLVPVGYISFQEKSNDFRDYTLDWTI